MPLYVGQDCQIHDCFMTVANSVGDTTCFVKGLFSISKQDCRMIVSCQWQSVSLSVCSSGLSDNYFMSAADSVSVTVCSLLQPLSDYFMSVIVTIIIYDCQDCQMMYSNDIYICVIMIIVWCALFVHLPL